MNSGAGGAENFLSIQNGQSFFFSFTKYMANDDFFDPPRRADSKNPIFIFGRFWVQVTSGALGSVSVGFWGGRRLSPFFWATA